MNDTTLNIYTELSEWKLFVEWEFKNSKPILHIESNKRIIRPLMVLLEKEQLGHQDIYTYEHIPYELSWPVERSSDMFVIYLPENIDIEAVFNFLKYVNTTPTWIIEPFFNWTAKENEKTGIVVKLPLLVPPGFPVPTKNWEQQKEIANEIDRVIQLVREKFDNN
jgi:hypothetical protein